MQQVMSEKTPTIQRETMVGLRDNNINQPSTLLGGLGVYQTGENFQSIIYEKKVYNLLCIVIRRVLEIYVIKFRGCILDRSKLLNCAFFKIDFGVILMM